jgi:hypothetical protein
VRTPKSTKLDGESLVSAVEEIVCGDASARQFVWAYYAFIHVIDDLFDRDVPLDAGTVALAFINYTETVAANPFFQAHRDFLLGLMRAGVLAWADSEEWRARPDVREKLAAEVIKSSYQEVLWAVAGLCGGLVHQRVMTSKYREYDWT